MDNNLITITGQLIEKPSYSIGKSKTLKIKLDRYPSLRFENSSVFLKATKLDLLLLDISKNDTVSIKVRKDRFVKFYINEAKLSLFEKVINDPINLFPIYSLEHKGKQYVGNIHEAAIEHRKEIFVFFILAGLALTVFSIYALFAKEKS